MSACSQLTVSITRETIAACEFFPEMKEANDECEHLDDEINSTEVRGMLEMFVEGCSCLYGDILDLIDAGHAESRAGDLESKLQLLADEGRRLSGRVPQIDTLVSLRLSTIRHAMIQLKSRSSFSPPARDEKGGVSALTYLRRWLQSSDDRLQEIECDLTDASADDIGFLRRLAANQQVLQLEIETDGQALVHTVQRENAKLQYTKAENENRDGPVLLRGSSEERRRRTLRSLTQRWHTVWLRSLSIQCRIEQAIERSHPNACCDDFDPELAEPSIKRRRLLVFDDSEEEEQGDTIPFTADEYESIMDMPTAHNTDSDAEYRNGRGRIVTDRGAMVGSSGAIRELKAAVGEGPWELVSQDIGYSSGENSVHEALNDLGSEEKTTKNEDDPDWQRRLRIHSSPVKSFYRTVAVDDALGTTESSELLRTAKTTWAQIEAANVADPLSDSLIVQTGTDLPLNDVESVLALFDEVDDHRFEEFDESLKDGVNRGTTWREIRGSNEGTRKPVNLDLIQCKKNSCDASSEESDEEPPSSTAPNEIVQVETPPTLLLTGDSNSNSLKRRYRTRARCDRPTSFCSQLKASLTAVDLNQSLCSSEMEVSTLSTSGVLMTRSLCLPPTPPSRLTRDRRRLRARRIPRSMSDGEHLSFIAKGNIVNGEMKMRHSPDRLRIEGAIVIDSDTTTAAEATTWEWDDYNPPAKNEDDDEDGTLRLDDQAVLSKRFGAADDYQELLASQSSEIVARVLLESRAALRTALRFLNYSYLSPQDLDDLTVGAHANIRQLHRALLRAGHDESAQLVALQHQWTRVLTMTSQHSPADGTSRLAVDEHCLALLQSKVERFARSLQAIHEQCCAARVPCITTSVQDITHALAVFRDVKDRLLEERDELYEILQSPALMEYADLSEDLKVISVGYSESLDKCSGQVHALCSLRECLNDWETTRVVLNRQLEIVEQRLLELERLDASDRQFQSSTKLIWTELELCDERMSRLETVCNCLVQSIEALQEPASADVSNYRCHLEDYSRSLSRIKMRFEKLASASCNEAVDVDGKGLRKRRYASAESDVEMKMRKETLKRRGVLHRIWRTVLESTTVQVLIALLVLVGLAAWLNSDSDVHDVNNWRYAWGPQLNYVRGAPPV